MVEIPLPEGYKPKKQTGKKQKKTKLKRGKSKAVSPSLNEKLSSDVEKKEPAQKFYDDIVWGDVKSPTTYDKFIVTGKIDEVEVYERTLIAKLAKASTYICLQARRWYEEEIVGDIAEWYKRWNQDPFRSRLAVIEEPYKDVDYSLTYMNLTAFRDNLKDGYKEMLRVANQCDRERIDYRGDLPTAPIREFKAAAAEFHGVVNKISIKSNAELDKLTGPDKKSGDNAGDDKKQPWEDTNLGYMYLSKAVVQFADNKGALSTWSKRVKHDQTSNIRYMTKGQRCKVHIGDFRNYIQTKHPEIEMAGEIADEFMANLEARKATERHRRKK
jgi:hypothetical protein